MCFLLRDYHSSEMVPRAAILQFLQQEYENVEGNEHLPHQFPVQMLPAVTQCRFLVELFVYFLCVQPDTDIEICCSFPAHGEAPGAADPSLEAVGKAVWPSQFATAPSPTRRSGHPGSAAMDTADNA